MRVDLFAFYNPLTALPLCARLQVFRGASLDVTPVFRYTYSGTINLNGVFRVNQVAADTTHDSIQVNAKDDRKIVFCPQNEDRFVLTCKEAIEAVQRGLGDVARTEETKALWRYVFEWVVANQASIHSCFLAVRDNVIVIFVVPNSPSYDEGLAAKLTDLDIELAEKFQYCRCEVTQVPGAPPETLACFLDEERALCLYGPQTPAGTA